MLTATTRPNAIVLQYMQFPWSSNRPGLVESTNYAGVDGSFLPFLLEEFLALSIQRIFVVEETVAGAFVQSLPETLVPYVTLVSRSSAFDRSTAYLEPVLKELGIRVENGGVCAPSTLDINRAQNFFDLFDSTMQFFVAIEHKAASDFNHPRLITRASQFRRECRSGAAREILAHLEGILSTYEVVSQPGVQACPTASPAQASHFLRLAEERDYAELADAAYNIGLPAQARRVLKRMKNLARAFVDNPKHKGLYDFTARQITAATKVPVPTSELLSMFNASEPYLPVDLTLADIARRARENWSHANPELIRFPGF